EEPPGSNYQTSFAFDNLPLFQPPHAERQAALRSVEMPGVDAGVNRGGHATLSAAGVTRMDAGPNRPVHAGGAPRRRPGRTPTRAFRRAFYPDVKDADWNDWRWQSRHRVRKLEQIERMLVLSDDEREALIKGESMLPVGITPYYMSLLDREDANQPLRRTVT